MFLPLSAFAGSVGTVTMTPISTSVPTLSSSMLIVLSLLLMIVAFRVGKQKESNKFFMMLVGASALIAAGGGIKVVSDLQAGFDSFVSLSNPAGGSVNIEINRYNVLGNNTAVPQSITNITLPPSGCFNFPNAGPQQYPDCSVGFTMEAQLGNQCLIDCRNISEPL